MPNPRTADLRIQALVFALVCAAFTSVYVTQPVLPILELEFGVSAASASSTISAVIAGIAIASLPSGWLADRVAIRRLIAIGGAMLVACCVVVAATHSFALLVAVRFVQGLFVPALTTCIAAYLARSLDARRLNVAMGAYVSATVAGGLGGRLLGGWIHPPLHWRYAFVTTAVLIALATVASLSCLPRESAMRATRHDDRGYLELVREPRLVAIFFTAAGAFCVFSSVFSFFPFYLAAPPLSVSTSIITAMYLTYVVGIFIGPLAGRISNRLGSGSTLMSAAVLFALALLGTLLAWLPVLILCLLVVCAGFFAIHASAVGALNRSVTASRGRANALYMLFYYLGGAIGINASGALYTRHGWRGVVLFNVVVLVVPFATGMAVHRRARRGATDPLEIP
ncbi:MAG TPA: MFS transporter [Casimicrobiaceae bacterium]|nr:MFS transporter [Casimicrobiaceae bacterium]